MIIPCMNSTSAAESGGSVACVEAGKVLVGSPGAPGCTTAGVGGSPACCASRGEPHTAAPTPTPSSMPKSATTFAANSNLCFKGKQQILNFEGKRSISSFLTLSCLKRCVKCLQARQLLLQETIHEAYLPSRSTLARPQHRFPRPWPRLPAPHLQDPSRHPDALSRSIPRSVHAHHEAIRLRHRLHFAERP